MRTNLVQTCKTSANRFNLNRTAMRVALIGLFITLGIGNAWANGGSSNYYASLKITQSGQTGAGSVYVANSNSKPGTANPETAVKSAATTTSGGDVTMYWWVDINPGYNVSLSGKVTGGPYSAASASGNVSCKASTSADGTQAYTATATFVAVTVNSVDAASKDLVPTNPSIDYPFTVTFATSNLKTIALDLNKSPETADGKFTITSWAQDGNNVVATGKFNGGGSYGGASRNNSTTVSLQSKASGSAVKTCTVTANFPAMAFVSASATEVFATQGESGKTGSATFTYNYGAEDDFPTAPTLTPVSGSGIFSVTGYTVTPNFSAGICTVTVDYEFDTNDGVGDTEATLTLTAANGDAHSITIAGHSEALATNDASVTPAGGEPTEYATFAQALAAANGLTGSTLKLLRNVNLGTITATYNITKAMTIDLNGKELRAAVNATSVGILTITAAVPVTIKDSKTGGKIINEIARNSEIRTIFVNKAGATLTLESGTIAVNNLGQYASAANADLGVAKYANCAARAIHQIAGSTVNINGGRVEAIATRNAIGIVQASSKANTTTLNVSGGEIYTEAPYAAYGIYAYGKVNISDGVINTHINTNMVDARYAADNANNTSNGLGYGIYMYATPSATASSCYFGTLTMTGGTINVISDRTKAASLYNYGIYLLSASSGVGAGKTGTDGSLSQKACAKASIENVTINVHSGTYYSYGIYTQGCYNSFDNTYFTIPIKNCTIDVKAYVYTYGIFGTCAINSTNGGCYWSDLELTNNTVTAESVTSSTAYAVYAASASATIFKDGTTTDAAVYGGEYATASKVVINSGTYTAKTKTTSAYAVCSSTRAKTVYDSETTVAANRKLGGDAEAYPIVIIHGGTFRGEATTTTSRAVSTGGYTTIDGGTFEAYSGTTTAYGLYAPSGKITASGVTITANATQNAYGAVADAVVPGDKSTAPTGFAYAGELELNNCDITATTRTATEARGVLVTATNQLYNWTKFHSDSTSGKWAAATTAEYYRQIYPCTIAGHDSVGIAIAAKATINGCDIKATAATTTAYGIYATATSVPATADSVASPVVIVKNTKISSKTNGTTSAFGVYAGGPTTIDGCDFTVLPKTTTAYGVYIYDKKTTITNTKFDVKGTTTAYGIYANAAIGSTTGWDYHGEVELGEGNDMTVAATGGNASHVLTLIATKKNVASGRFLGDYANAASAHVTGGTYKATATGTTSYVLNLSDRQVQGAAIAMPSCTIEGGKFWAMADGGTTGIVSTNGQVGSIVLGGGFYNVNTNLARYKEEGKNINDVPAGAPEYTEGYRYEISSELSGGTVCKVYQGNTLKQSYATLEEALQFVNANTGTNYTIVMVADYMLKKGDYLLPSNATLVIPNDLARKAAMGTKPTRDEVDTPVPVQLVMLTFDNGVNMTVKGTIETSAVNTAASGGKAITGAPTGNYGRLHLVEGSTITLESGANLNCWGYTTGKGEINALSGAIVREGFQLGYWRGGTATSSMLNNKDTWHAFPVTDYFIQNVEAPITFRPGAQLLGYSAVTVSIIGTQAANDVKLVGTDKSMFLMDPADASEDTYVRKAYDAETDRAVWTVNSGAKIGSFSFSLAGSTVNSADYYLPISNNMTIYVNEGEFIVTQDALLIPGAQVIISKLGKLTVASGKRLFVMDNEDWPGFVKHDTGATSRWYYNATYSPSWTSNPRTTIYPPTTTRLPDAEIFVEGETEGSYYTSTHGANIHSTNEDAGKVKFVAAAGANNSIQHVVNTDCDRVTINFTTAQLKNETPETPYTSSVGTLAGEAFVYMESQWVKVIDGCLTTRTDGSGTHEYAKPSDVVEVVSNGDNAYRDVATNSRYFINAEKALSSDECVWWEVEPVASGTYVGDYMANQTKYDNYGAYYYYDGTSGYWKPRYVTVTWKNQDGSTLATYTNVMCNTSPKYLSASPTWANTAIEKHDWVGWRDAEGNIYDKNAVLPPAQGNVTYTAYYNTSKYQYTITFKNPNNSIIWVGLVEAGTVPVCPVTPTQASTVSTDYTFTNWSGYAADATLPTVTGTATYTAQYSESPRKYHVTFYNYDAVSVLYEADVAYNTRPVYSGVTPFRANTSAYSYEWTGWRQGENTYDTDDALALVTGDVYYVATFSPTPLKYQVFFKRQDGTTIDAPFFEYEETPAAFPADPTMASTVSTDYTFDHWDPATLTPVTEDGKVYTAYFSESPRQYTAHFVNYDGASLNVDQTIDYNTAPTYTGAEPIKPNDSRNSFEFSGWAWPAGDGWEAGSIGVGEAFPAIKGDITFTAQYNPVLLQFDVIYQREDGTVILRDKKKWGENTAFPTSGLDYEDATYTYTFNHWSPATVVNPVITDATYTAYYNRTVRTYSFSSIAVTPAGYGTVSPASLAGIPGGSAVTVNGNKITVNGTTITATPTAATAQYTYAFDHWNNVPATVTGNISNIEAVFTRTVNQYDVTFNMKGHGAAISKQTKDYGSKVDKPADPSEAGYTFVGWYKEDACTNAWNFASDEVTGTTILFAKWTVNPYTITFDSNGGSTVASITQNCGTAVTPPANPTRTGYTFAGWLPEVPATMPVDGETCVAQWTINSYQIKFVDEDGTTNLGSYPQTLDYGAVVTAPEEPTKAADATNVYTFAGWSDGVSTYASADIPAVSGAVTYTATYNSAPTVASVTVGGATTYYATLQAAFDYAADKTTPTIKVLADIALAAKVTYTNTSKTTVTIDLNGHTVSGALNPLLTLTSASSTGGLIVIKSSVEGGQIRNRISSTSARYCISLSKGKLRLESGTIYNENTNTGASYAVSSSRTFTMTGGKLEAKGKTGVYPLYSTGTSNISGGSIVATETTSGTTAGVFAIAGTTTISGEVDVHVTGTTSVYGARVGLRPNTSGAVYNGTLNITGGTFNVHASASSALGVYSYAGTRAIDNKGNYACAGTANISGGEFTVTSDGAKAYGVFVTGAVSIATAKDADGNATYASASATSKANVTGGKFNVSGTSDVMAVNTSAANTDLVVEGGWYNLNTNLDGYTAPTKEDCNYHVLDLPSSELPYKYEVAEAYNITFKDGDNTTIQEGPVKKGVTPAYTGETPTKTEDANYTYTFNNSWEPAIVPATAAATYTAQFTGTPKSQTYYYIDPATGEIKYVSSASTPENPADYDDEDYTYGFSSWTDNGDGTYTASYSPKAERTYGTPLDIVDWTADKIVVNANGLKAAEGGTAWEIKYDGDYVYNKNTRTTDRRLLITRVSETPDSYIVLKLKGTGGVERRNKYLVPHIYDASATLSGTEETRVVYVHTGATLTINDNTTIKDLYVSPGANVVVSNGNTLTISGKLVLRTLPWQSAAIEGDVDAAKTFYTRIAPNGLEIDARNGKTTYTSSPYYQLALPYECNIEDVLLSDGSKPEYNKTWLLKSYSESSRATKGATENNWVAVSNKDTDTKIKANTGYEFYSNSTYYREYYFPVAPTDNKTVTVDRSEGDNTNAGWNMICSPLMSNHQKNPRPEDITVSWLNEEGKYDQSMPDVIPPAIPFFYQAAVDKEEISFAGTNVTPSLAPRRRIAAADEPTRIQWIRLDVKDAKGEGDETNIYSHPTRYEQYYQTGIDVAKQSLTAARARLYSSHAYGDMAFAGVSDELFEQGVALTVYSPAAQELTFSLRQNEWLNRLQYVWIIDFETGAMIDLLSSDYTAEVTEGTTYGRFYISGRFRTPQIATDIEPTSDSSLKGRAQKVLIEEKIYIMVGDKLYDATGKLVKGK